MGLFKEELPMKFSQEQISVLEEIAKDGSLVSVCARNKYSQRFNVVCRVDYVQEDGVMLNFNTGIERGVGNRAKIDAFFYNSPSGTFFSKNLPEGFFVEKIDLVVSPELPIYAQEHSKTIFENNKKTDKAVRRLCFKNFKRLYNNFDLRLTDGQVDFYAQFIGDRFKATTYSPSGKQKVVTGVLDSVSRSTDSLNPKLYFGYYNGFDFDTFSANPYAMSFEIIKANNISFDVSPVQPKAGKQSEKELGTIEQFNKQFTAPRIERVFPEHKRVSQEVDCALSEIFEKGIPTKKYDPCEDSTYDEEFDEDCLDEEME